MFENGGAKELLIVLATAGIVVPVLGRLRIGAVPAFLIAGVVLGPGGLGGFVAQTPWLGWITISAPERVQPFAELGVLFLLFLIGLEFSIDRLWAMRRYVLGIGPVQVLVSAAAIVGTALAIGIDLRAAIVLGLALALSSTAIVMQTLIDTRRLALPVGRLSLGVLIFQDLMVVPIVIVVGLLGGDEVTASDALVRAIGLAIAAIAAIVVAGRFVLRPLMRVAAATKSRDLVVGVALFLAIGTALLTEEVGLSAALGAFLAGLLLGESEYRHQLEVDIEPFKGLLLGLFFMTVGMSLDLAAITIGPLAFAAAVLTLVVIKGVVMVGAARLFGVDSPVAIEGAFLLAGAGEFAFVVFTLARSEQLVEPGFLQFLVSVSALSMILVPMLGYVGRRAGGWLAARDWSRSHGIADSETLEFADHVIIGGYGRVGRMVGHILDMERIPYVALDLDADNVARAHEAGDTVFYGDASRREILDRVGAAKARAFVVTTDEPVVAERMTKAIMDYWPKAVVHARARDRAHARRLVAMGAGGVVPETLESSLQLAAQVLSGIGLPDETVESRLSAVREEEFRRLSEQSG